MIVAGHVNSQYSLSIPGELPNSYWFFSNSASILFRCAVPMFLMISGYLILRKPNSLKHGYFKRLLKIGIPLLVWSIIYLTVRQWVGDVDRFGNPIDRYMFLENPGNFINSIGFILSGNVGHLWFLCAILSLYIAAPILHSYLKSASRENKQYFLILWLCACFVWPILSRLLEKIFNVDNVNFDFYIVNTTVGYFVAGYFLGHLTFSTRTCLVCLVSFILLAAAVTLGGYMLSHGENNARVYYGDFMRIPLSLMVFVIFKYIGSTKFCTESFLSVVITYLASFTFGIYIVHMLVIAALDHGVCGFSLSIRSFDPWFSCPLVGTAVFALSVFFVWILRKIPLVRQTLP